MIGLSELIPTGWIAWEDRWSPILDKYLRTLCNGPRIASKDLIIDFIFAWRDDGKYHIGRYTAERATLERNRALIECIRDPYVNSLAAGMVAVDPYWGVSVDHPSLRPKGRMCFNADELDKVHFIKVSPGRISIVVTCINDARYQVVRREIERSLRRDLEGIVPDQLWSLPISSVAGLAATEIRRREGIFKGCLSISPELLYRLAAAARQAGAPGRYSYTGDI